MDMRCPGRDANAELDSELVTCSGCVGPVLGPVGQTGGAPCVPAGIGQAERVASFRVRNDYEAIRMLV